MFFFTLKHAYGYVLKKTGSEIISIYPTDEEKELNSAELRQAGCTSCVLEEPFENSETYSEKITLGLKIIYLVVES